MRGQPVTLNTLRDVDPTGLADGDAPLWDAAAKQYKPGSTVLLWKFDTFTIASTSDTIHTLTWLPHGINVALLNGLGLVEGGDYSCDYATGVVTVSTTLTAGDVLHVRYVTSGVHSNLLTDPEAEFETGLSTDWQVPPGTVADQTITRVSGGHTGSYAMEFYTAAGDPSPMQAMLYRDIPIVAGVAYTLRAWAYPVNRLMAPHLRVTSFNGTGGYGVATVIDTLSVVSPGISAGTWGLTEDTTLTFSAGSLYARILLAEFNASASGAGDRLDFDDIYFNQT